MISVGIIGGTGYTGKHLIKYCDQHQFVEEYKVYANSSAGSNLLDVFPELHGVIGNQEILSVNNLSYEHDVYFVALPHGESLNYIPKLYSDGKKVIDLGGDFRLDDAKLYQEWYGYNHFYNQLLSKKIYGLADYDQEKIHSQKLIANPGCYPTSVLLSTLPIASELSDKIISLSTVSYSGTSGAGKSPKTALLLSEMDGNAKAYNINKHRHQPEILQQLNKVGFNSHFSFTSHLLPIATGIYSTTAIHFDGSVNKDEIKDIYKTKFANSPFVRLRETAPEIKWVVGTNFCDINVNVNDSVIIVTCAIDNLIKGASGQAIQNMNIMFGWNEQEGILNSQSFEYTEASGSN